MSIYLFIVYLLLDSIEVPYLSAIHLYSAILNTFPTGWSLAELFHHDSVSARYSHSL